MKQMDVCLDRVFLELKPLPNSKWKAMIVLDHLLLVYHYTHYVLGYDIKTHTVFHEWWERPADKRGLEAAKEYLKERFKT